MSLAASYWAREIRTAVRVSREGRDRIMREAAADGLDVADIAKAARLSVARTRAIIAAGGTT